MHIGDTSSNSRVDDSKPLRGVRKSTRLHDARSGPTSNPRTKEEDAPSPTTTSSSSSGSKKRLLTLHEVVNGEGTAEGNMSAESRSPQSATSIVLGDHSPQVCLCQPEPKIPRPRNAFILYRQHHQQAIIARNPGLNNPDISKIIGEQWKAESEESKKVWQDLAQEEKARHQEQYPDYRYQPRRCGKSGSTAVNAQGQQTAIDKYRCPRCGGRSIKTPTSPFLDSSGTPTLPPPNYSEGATPTTRYLPIMSNLSLESPVRRRGPGPSALSNIQVPPLREDNAVNSPGTPGYKKRRFDYGPPSAGNSRRPEGPYYPQYARRDSLPPIQVRYSPPNSATMPPPRTPRDGRRPVAHSEPMSATHPEQSSRSIEEVLMTFPYQNKIKLLGRISLPYKEPAPNDPARHVRGVIIAIEGDDTVAVKELTDWLNERLLKDTETIYQPRIADPPRAPDERGATFEGYLDLIKEWHGRSKDMIDYITASTTSPTPTERTISSDHHSPKRALAPERKDSASESGTPPTPPPADAVCSTSPPRPQPTPVILLPTFQLSASIAYASRIPIQDAYSTTDHWQWMATLWRGTVGPDLTIYVKSYDRDQGGQKPEMDDAVRCLTVWKEREGRFGDGDLRRVMFEVGEFVAGVSAGGKEA